MNRWGRGAVAVVLAAATALAGYAIEDAASAGEQPVLGPGLVTFELGIRYSKFSVPEIRVRPGTVVEFRVRNDDPIYHEFVTGDVDVHRRHQTGTEAKHPPVPGEVTVKPHDTGVTFFRFDAPGRYEYACHLPGHYEFGMTGWIIVD
jgi:uncharacterized cupredoxin-like copper-binding protein